MSQKFLVGKIEIFFACLPIKIVCLDVLKFSILRASSGPIFPPFQACVDLQIVITRISSNFFSQEILDFNHQIGRISPINRRMLDFLFFLHRVPAEALFCLFSCQKS